MSSFKFKQVELMMTYPEKIFTKNGQTVNAVYIVKKGDHLLKVKRQIEKTGGDFRTALHVNADLTHQLREGDFIFYYSNMERSADQKDLILNDYELGRVPYEVLEVSGGPESAKAFQEKFNSPTELKSVLVQNRIPGTLPKSGTVLKVKIYENSKSQLGVQNSSDEAMINRALRDLNRRTELMEQKYPASQVVPDKSTNKQLHESFAVSSVLILCFLGAFVFALWKSRNDLKNIDLLRPHN